jgi:IS5 family transposase
VDRVIVDTTVMPKAVAYPTDSALLETARQHMVKLAGEHGIALR